MMYAVVITYTDGHSDTTYINQKAKNATTENACLMGFVFLDNATGHYILSINYVSELCDSKKSHPVVMGNIDVDTSNVVKVCVYNVEQNNGRIILGSLLSVPYNAHS